MDRAVKDYIRGKLDRLAKDHNIAILHAIESGSRAWGFPSKDSDYDVRFIYTHDMDYYLSVDRRRDVIETPIEHDDVLGVEFDMGGWDIKKTIGLAIRGNVVVHEWLTSPIVYQSHQAAQKSLLKFANDVADLDSYFYAYRNKTYKSWVDNAHKHEIRIKNYCYSLRCAMCIEWVKKHQTPPPMDVLSLMVGLDMNDGMRNAIDAMIASKAVSSEKDVMPRQPELDAFINGAVLEEFERPSKDDQEEANIDTANNLFREIIKE